MRNYNDIDIEYWTDIRNLEVGVEFFVRNGYWRGRIVLKNGVKCVENDMGTFKINMNKEYLLLI